MGNAYSSDISNPFKTAPAKPVGKVYYLFLDVQTTTEDMPQLVALDAVLYSYSNDKTYHQENSMSAIVRPKRGYSVLRHMQDVRFHGVPAEVMASKGQDAFHVVNQMFIMLRLAMNLEAVQDDNSPATLVVVGHSVQGMMTNLMAAAKVESSLHPLWDELESLCQQDFRDTLDDARKTFSNLTNYTVASLLGECGRALPGNRAQAVAELYFALANCCREKQD